MSRISEFIAGIEHISGKDNIIADTLPRINNVSEGTSDVKKGESFGNEKPQWHELFNAVTVLQAQQADAGLQRWIRKHAHGPKSPYKPGLVPLADSPGNIIQADKAREPPIILVPSTLQRSIFDNLHSLAHRGPKAMYKLMKQTYYWSNMKKDIIKWIRSCEPCQKNKVARHTISPAKSLPKPTRRFEHTHMDLVGPINLHVKARTCFSLSLIDGQRGQKQYQYRIFPCIIRTFLAKMNT